MNNKEFLEFLNDCPLDMSEEEMLKNIIDEEMNKPQDEMDTELIELCLDSLQKINNQVTENISEHKKKPKNGKRILLIAAIIIVIVCGAFTVSATVFKTNLFENIIKVFDDRISIDFNKLGDDDDKYNSIKLKLKTELRDNIVGWTRLPKKIYSSQIDYDNIVYNKTATVIKATIPFKIGEKENKMVIEHYSQDTYIPEVTFEKAKNLETFRVNDLTIFVFEQNGCYILAYRHNLSIYTVTLKCSYDEAVSFAKSIEDEIESLDINYNKDAELFSVQN